MSQSQRPSGRYRFQGDRRLDPNEGVHPEMAEGAALVPIAAAAGAALSVPSSPSELIAMQHHPDRPEKPVRRQSAKVQQVIKLIEELDTSAAEDLQIALLLVRHLERFHDEVVEEMQNDDSADRKKLTLWSIDADRMMHVRILLESVDLD